MAGKLTARSAITTKPGTYSDGDGLYRIVNDKGSGKWVYRFTFNGKVRNMGLGSSSLAEARLARNEAKSVKASGRNPIDVKRESKKIIPTFGEFADEVFEVKRSEWRNVKHTEQWQWTLTVACEPLRSMSIDKVDTDDVLSVLKPLWLEKPETATRVRQRIEVVLNAAKARKLRSGENPAAWRGHLEHLLPKRPKLARRHHAAMPYKDVPDFMDRLRQENYTAARALEFTILTAARSGEVFGALWSEIDLSSKVWVIPSERMKAGREHRVPLSSYAVSILKEVSQYRAGEFVFPSPRGNQRLSHVAMQNVLSRLGITNATVHGFRSSFRDWAGHETYHSREVAEQSLAHRLGDGAELAYKHGDFLEKRRKLMEEWSTYCFNTGSGNILKFTRASV